jgi:hypothetical protein
MSKPFAVALLGLLVVVASLTCGELARSKGAGPFAFLVGGTLMLGGLAVGALREATGRK